MKLDKKVIPLELTLVEIHQFHCGRYADFEAATTLVPFVVGFCIFV
jgi:hypothetical protein